MTTFRDQLQNIKLDPAATTSRIQLLRTFTAFLQDKFAQRISLNLEELAEPIGDFPTPWRISVDTGNIYHWGEPRQANNTWYPATVEVEVIVEGHPAQKQEIQNWVDQAIYWIRNSKPFGQGTRSQPRISVVRIPRNLNQSWPYAEVIDIEVDCRLGDALDLNAEGELVAPVNLQTVFAFHWYTGQADNSVMFRPQLGL